MNKKLFLLTLLFIFNCITAQNAINTEVDSKFYFEAEQFVTKDVYDNYYFITNNNLIKTNNQKTFFFKEVTLGKIEYVSVLNPLQIMVFYKDFNTVVLLDNQLNETHRIKGNNYTILFQAVDLARQNNLWFYDANSLQFGTFNFVENTFKYISTPTSFSIKNYKSDYNQFYWITDDNHFFSINYFGKITLLQNLDALENVKIINDKAFLAKKNGKINYYINNAIYEILVDKNSTDFFCFKDGFLSIFTNNYVTNYKIELP